MKTQDNAEIKSLNFRGLERQRCVRAPNKAVPRLSTADSAIADVLRWEGGATFHV